MPITTVKPSNGFLPDALPEVLSHGKCSVCRVRLSRASYSLPDYLLIELELFNLKNITPVLIPEAFVLGDLYFELVVAILVRPDHFFCIIKNNQQFFVVGDLKETADAFCFFFRSNDRELSTCPRSSHNSDKEYGKHVLICCLSNQQTNGVSSNKTYFITTKDPKDVFTENTYSVSTEPQDQHDIVTDRTYSILTYPVGQKGIITDQTYSHTTEPWCQKYCHQPYIFT